MVEPVSTALIIWGAERIASWIMRSQAKNKLQSSKEEHQTQNERHGQALAEHRSQSRATLYSMNALGGIRARETVYNLGRAVRAAALLDPSRDAFTRERGFFGGKSLKEARRIVELVRALDARIPASDDLAKVSGAALVLAHGLEAIDVLTPHDLNIHDAIAALPLDGAGGWADALGAIGDIGFADALGVFGVLISGGALWKASQEAGKIREKAAEIARSADKLEADTRRLRPIERRCAAISTELSAQSYQTFRLSWASEKLAGRRRTERLLPPHHRAIIDRFEHAARRLYFLLTTPITDASGRAETLPAI